MFRAAKQNKIFQDVVDQIQEAILSGKLQPGDVLPSERELKELLQVSRGTLREALRVLEQKGLVHIKLGVGGGAVVQDVSYEPVSESLALLIRHQKVSLAHLAEFRAGVEGEAASNAARRISSAETAHLKHLLDQAVACAERTTGRTRSFLQADKAIHLNLATISSNPISIFVHKSIHENIDRYYEQFLVMDPDAIQENIQDLRAIVQAVISGDAEQARRLATSHVYRFTTYMQGVVDQNPNQG
ncbi:FadR/GntR family transcriptional regulator [Desulfovermiculus halophilus]|jgi:DNA-binding FadR family transcriptional regulator|uniref:FadR/GntR family transcriptional regulator n=1 Tax=Desulfovermiculus halophilus TaxID=339722 RepID=UPI000482764A|nr:FadR/GntR family transcriptional regulator [Desulfovermiculus halophilus]